MKYTRSTKPRGYSFAEVLVASAFIGAAIGGAVKMLATMNLQERAANNYTVALNMQDNAAHLWQLGLTPATAYAILPKTTDNNDLADALVPSSGNSVSFGTAGSVVLANSMGTLETIPCTLTILNPTGNSNRSQTVTVCRPSYR
jgi:Tfp pilus assembly protein PilV